MGKNNRNVICIKWRTKFSSNYVNNLYKMVKKNLTSKTETSSLLQRLLILILSLILLASIPFGIWYEISEQEREQEQTSKIILPQRQWYELTNGQRFTVILHAITGRVAN